MPSSSPLQITLIVLLVATIAKAELGFVSYHGNRLVTELPATIRAFEGKVTLVADFSSGGKEGVPVYLINSTDAPVTLSGDGGGLDVMLEYQERDGAWIRAQPHGYSFCGNSYGNWLLKPHHFTKLQGFQPNQGRPATIRFRLYNEACDIVSNSGTGIVLAEDIRKAANDAMAVYFGNLDFVMSVALGIRILHNEMDHIRSDDMKLTAMRQLASGRFEERAVFKLLSKKTREAPGRYLVEVEQIQEEFRRAKRQSGS
jgi:hypothetical protein